MTHTFKPMLAVCWAELLHRLEISTLCLLAIGIPSINEATVIKEYEPCQRDAVVLFLFCRQDQENDSQRREHTFIFFLFYQPDS